MNNKLQNIKAVKELLAGEHKSQRRRSMFMGKTKQELSESDIIEKFEDGKPKIWIETDSKGFRTRVTQHDGFKSREPENSILKTIQDILKSHLDVFRISTSTAVSTLDYRWDDADYNQLQIKLL